MKKNLSPKTSKLGKLKVCSIALHPEFSYPLITVAEMSIEKGYKPLNWLDKKNGVTVMYLIEAAQRHLDKIKLGIDINTEEQTLDQKPVKNIPTHAAQVAYNMLMLDLQQKVGVAIDDRQFVNGQLKTDCPSRNKCSQCGYDPTTQAHKIICEEQVFEKISGAKGK